jgi:hypothetical protein
MIIQKGNKCQFEHYGIGEEWNNLGLSKCIIFI